MKKRKNIFRFSFLLLLLTLAGTVSFAVVFPSVTRCYLVDFTSMVRVSARLYVSNDYAKKKEKRLIKEIPLARKRVAAMFGKATAHPVILAVSDEKSGELYGGKQVNTALSHLTPVGTFVVLCPEGQNVDVIAHELVHAELHKRIGWWQREVNIPTWFDEGLAMQLDYRPIYNENVFFHKIGQRGDPIPELNAIDTPDEFFTEDYWLNYSTAKFEVARWYRIVGRGGLLEFMEMIREGKAFEDAYSATEKKFMVASR